MLWSKEIQDKNGCFLGENLYGWNFAFLPEIGEMFRFKIFFI